MEKQKSSIRSVAAYLSSKTAVVITIVLVIVMSIAKENFFTVTNLFNIMRQMAITAFACFGVLAIIGSGNMDLAAGSNVAFSACFIGVLYKQFGITNGPVLIVACLLCSTLVGIIDALICTKLHMAAFIATLGMNMFWRGMAMIITGAATISATAMPLSVRWLGVGTIGGKFPVSFIFVIASCVILHIILTKTVFGRSIFFIGNNQQAARLAGINTDMTIIKVFALEGFMCGLSALTTIGRVSAATPSTATNLGMDCIAAVVIGGAAFTGGNGTVWGALAGTVLMTVINSALNFMGTPSYVQDVCVGAILLFAVWLDATRTRAAENARRKAQAKADLEAISESAQSVQST